MNYANIKYNDIANGEGIRTSLFVSGCSHHCQGCFNKVTWDYNYGKKFNKYTLFNIIKSLIPEYIEGLTILGGEPLDDNNVSSVYDVVATVKEAFVDKKNIWIYSGYTWEEILEDENKFKVVSMCDILVDGRFIEEEKDISLWFKGSSNQRTIDIQQSISEHDIILYHE